jgi:hypothetical protein
MYHTRGWYCGSNRTPEHAETGSGRRGNSTPKAVLIVDWLVVMLCYVHNTPPGMEPEPNLRILSKLE